MTETFLRKVPTSYHLLSTKSDDKNSYVHFSDYDKRSVFSGIETLRELSYRDRFLMIPFILCPRDSVSTEGPLTVTSIGLETPHFTSINVTRGNTHLWVFGVIFGVDKTRSPRKDSVILHCTPRREGKRRSELGRLTDIGTLINHFEP